MVLFAVDLIQLNKKMHKQHHSQLNKIWINNGIVEKYTLSKNIPDGFIYGRLKHKKL